MNITVNTLNKVSKDRFKKIKDTSTKNDIMMVLRLIPTNRINVFINAKTTDGFVFLVLNPKSTYSGISANLIEKINNEVNFGLIIVPASNKSVAIAWSVREFDMKEVSNFD